ncbi:hypothetical protein BS78_02G065200 [Paspalum vaginatum]|nr:hypothetical protein BS78_02G065200 [Paspalum vaginatum]
MPCTLSMQKRSRPTEAAVAAVVRDWSSSLPSAIAVGVCKRLLADDDIDCYMAFRSVCHNWRSNTKHHPVQADYTNQSWFQPTKWALLDRQDDLITLVNVNTGRFLRKSLPLLCRYSFVSATGGGLILLAEQEEPHQARLLNPFTGSIAKFLVPVQREGVRSVVVTLAPLMVFVSTECGDIMWADQSSQRFKRFWRTNDSKPTCMASFDGDVHAADPHGSIFSSTIVIDHDDEATEAELAARRSATTISMGLGTTIRCLDASLDANPYESPPSALTRNGGRYILMESRGNLLLVTRPSDVDPDDLPLVRRVDIYEGRLERIDSIGNNHAIFVSQVRCLSINIDRFHGIKGGYIYFMEPMLGRGDHLPSTITSYSVNDGRRQGLVVVSERGSLEGCFRPLTLAQVFAGYCRTIHCSEVQQVVPCEWDWDLSDTESDNEASSGYSFLASSPEGDGDGVASFSEEDYEGWSSERE